MNALLPLMPRGPAGPRPQTRWNEKRLEVQKQDGTWDASGPDLQGPPGASTVEAEAARDLAASYRDQAATYRDQAEVQKTGAETARDQAIAAAASAPVLSVLAEAYSGVPNDTSVDNAVPIATALAQPARDVQLLAGGYSTSTGVDVPLGSILRGKQWPRTYLFGRSATADILRLVGPDGALTGGGPFDYYADFQSPAVEELYAYRQVTATFLGGINGASPAGVRLKNALRGSVRRVFSFGNQIGFYSGRVIDAEFIRNVAIVQAPAGKYAFGYFIDCLDLPGSSARPNGNASTRMSGCTAAGSGGGGTEIGLYVAGYFSDLYVSDFIAGAIDYGVFFDGLGDDNPVKVDAELLNVRVDQFKIEGMHFQNFGQRSSLKVQGGYCAPTTATGAAVSIINSTGIRFCAGHEIIAYPEPTLVGYSLTGAKRCVIDNTCMVMSAFQPVITSGGFLNVIEPIITAHDTRASGKAAVAASNEHQTTIAPVIDGPNGAFAVGVSLDSSCGKCVVDLKGVQSGTCTTLCRINGVTVTGNGTYNGNTVINFNP